MKRYFLFLLVAIGLISCRNNDRSFSRDVTVPVTVETVKKSSIVQYINTTGTVNPKKEAVIKTDVEGLYNIAINPRTNRPFRLGDKIKKDEVIIRIVNPEYENDIKLPSLELELEIAKQTYQKQESLYKKGGVTLSDYKNAEISMINSEYNYNSGKINLEKLNVKAPFDGILVDMPYYTEKTNIDAGTEVFTIMDYYTLYMDISLAEKNMKDIQIDQEVRITNYSIPDDTLSGRISQIAPVIDPESRTFKTMIVIDNSDLFLRPGMYAKGEIITARSENTIVIPKDIILSKQRGSTVFVVEKGLAQPRILEFGLENPDMIEVLKGLDEKDRLIVKGFETLNHRTKVKEVK